MKKTVFDAGICLVVAAAFLMRRAWPVLLLAGIVVCVRGYFEVILPRLRMGRKARELEAKISRPEHVTIELQFRSFWPSRKRMEIANIEVKMTEAGWTLLRQKEAARSEVRWTMNGGLDLQFIRERNVGADSLAGAEILSLIHI